MKRASASATRCAGAGRPVSGPIPLFRVELPVDAAQTVATVLASGRLAQGPRVAALEAAWADHFGSPAVAVRDASAALTLALHLAGVKAGDEVVVSPLACLASTSPILNLGAHPAWCDVDPDTGMPSAAHVAAALSPRTRAVLLYHWAGDVGPIEALAALCRARKLPLIEDATEAFGATVGERPLGRQGADFTVYAFGPVRQISTVDGAALMLPADLRARATRLRRFGIDAASFRLPSGDLNPASDIVEPGWNFPMNELDAALITRQFERAAGLVEAIRRNGLFFDRALADVPGVRRLARRSDAVSGYWTYALRATRRDALVARLHAAGIGAQRLHVRNDGYSGFSGVRRPQHLPGADLFDRENLCIPCGPWVSPADAERIAACIRDGA